MSDVFISSAREDHELAQRLAGALTAQGWSVWWDPRIRCGRSSDRIIEQALTQARCVVVIGSRHAVDSDWVRAGARYAKAHGKLVPVLADAIVQPWLQFRHVHAAPLAGWAGDLASAVFAALANASEHHVAPVQPNPSTEAVAQSGERRVRPATDGSPSRAPEGAGVGVVAGGNGRRA